MRHRYLVYNEKDLTSSIYGRFNNKSEAKKYRTSWKYQMLLINHDAYIYDTKENTWIA